MSKKILVIGAGGMAGHVIATHLSEKGYAVTTLSAHNKLDSETVLMDVTNRVAFEQYLKERPFDVIVNCIGMLVKASDERKDLATYINSYLPHEIEERFKNTSTKIIHLSTDCVFSGRNAPYSEQSWPDGELFYDRTKALGEIVNSKDLTFRMSIIGPDAQKSGVGLFNWFYAQTGIVNGFTGSVWNGVTTIELAKAIDNAIQYDLCGLYHLVPQENITKYNLLQLIKVTFSRDDITLNPVDGISHDKTLINNRTDFNHIVPTYPKMIEEMKQWILAHSNLYKHYEVKD
jgi:dTDP-4-dehydrorhamnose reductase